MNNPNLKLVEEGGELSVRYGEYAQLNIGKIIACDISARSVDDVVGVGPSASARRGRLRRPGSGGKPVGASALCARSATVPDLAAWPGRTRRVPPAGSLALSGWEKPDRTALAAALVGRLEHHYQALKNEGLETLQRETREMFAWERPAGCPGTGRRRGRGRRAIRKAARTSAPGPQRRPPARPGSRPPFPAIVVLVARSRRAPPVVGSGVS